MQTKQRRVEIQFPAEPSEFLASMRRSIPWTEKYRPRFLDEIESQEAVVRFLRCCVNGFSPLPHLLFHGPPGTGKTSTILALARELYGPDHFSARVKELNASDDRGINVVREHIKTFCSAAVSSLSHTSEGEIGIFGIGGTTATPSVNRVSSAPSSSVTSVVSGVARGVQSDGRVYPLPPHRLLILDEADALLPDAQAALRRVMEDAGARGAGGVGGARVALLCNDPRRLLDALCSRCAVFRFHPLPPSAMAQCLRRAVRHAVVSARDEVDGGVPKPSSRGAEDAAGAVKITEDAMERLLRFAGGGDLRRAMVVLQGAVSRVGAPQDDGSLVVGVEDVLEAGGGVAQGVMESYLQGLESGSFEDMKAATEAVIGGGYSASAVLEDVRTYLEQEKGVLSPVALARVALKLCETERRVQRGGDEWIQLLDFGASFVEMVRLGKH